MRSSPGVRLRRSSSVGNMCITIEGHVTELVRARDTLIGIGQAFREIQLAKGITDGNKMLVWKIDNETGTFEIRIPKGEKIKNGKRKI